MVLIPRCLVVGALGALVLAGCNQSLFDNHGPNPAGDAGPGSDGAPDGGIVAATCPMPCLADAAGDFDGSPGGLGGRWRYLDDLRNRRWTPMTGAMTKMGGDPANRITTCALNPSAPACVGLPGALLISSSGSTSPADPAIELTVQTKQVIRLDLRGVVASGAAQQIRLYRNSREDVLYTALAAAGAPAAQSITLDALAGDRFLVAVAPAGAGGDVAVQLFASPTGDPFPLTCQVAMSFTTAAGNTIENQCGAAFTHGLYSGGDTAPPLVAGPYSELGSAADVTADSYFKGADILDKTHDLTVQLWVKHGAFVSPSYDAWLFSDLDLNSTGGLGIAITNVTPPMIYTASCATVTPTTLTFAEAAAPYPDDGNWHFVRVTHTSGHVYACVDGKLRTNFAALSGSLKSGFPPYLGANVVWGPQGAFLNGQIDDLRVLTGALPCAN